MGIENSRDFPPPSSLNDSHKSMHMYSYSLTFILLGRVFLHISCFFKLSFIEILEQMYVFFVYCSVSFHVNTEDSLD